MMDSGRIISGFNPNIGNILFHVRHHLVPYIGGVEGLLGVMLS
jgi:hypothetical protein